MAFRNLVEGDCGNPSSLISLATHFVKDHGFKEEGIHRPFGPSDTFQTPDAGQFVHEFLEESACPQTFRMDDLLQKMIEIDQNIPPPIAPPGMIREIGLDAEWANQYLESGRHFEEPHVDAIWNTSAGNIHLSETHQLGLNPKWAEEYVEQNMDSAQNVNKIDDVKLDQDKDLDFEFPRESNQTGLFDIQDAAEELVQEYDQQKIDTDNCTIDDSTILNKVEEELEAAGTGWADEFVKDSTPLENNNNSAFWNRLEAEWDKISTLGELSSSHPWLSEYDTYYDPFKNYEFHETNPMKNLPNALEEGKKRLEEGDLPSAVLCFEAAVQQDENNVEAWLFLGRTQAENEQDSLAIPALKRCLSLDPSNGIALMALAVCYTNESYQRQACLTLREWLLKNEKYKHLPVPKPHLDQHPKSSVSTMLFDDVHNEVEQLYIQAARMNPRDEIDPDVQCGLGVLFSLSCDYEKAADCFKTALQMRPDDSRLWNRWGATLANGHRSAEAITAYHRALELSPGFIRARYNLGISCINLGAYQQAGEHLLTALNQQAAGRSIEVNTKTSKAMSNTIWSTLRLVLSLMHKYNLMGAIENRDLQRLNEEFELT